MLRYKLYQDNRRNATNKGAWYARPAITQTYSLEDLAQHMAEHDTPFSKGAIYGVLTDMVKCIQGAYARRRGREDSQPRHLLRGIEVGIGRQREGLQCRRAHQGLQTACPRHRRVLATDAKQRVKIRQYDEYKVSTDEPETEPTEP